MMAIFSIGDRPHAKYCVESFKNNMPDIKIVQITDKTSQPIEGVHEIIRKDMPDGIMVERIKAFAELDFDDILITMGDDCIVDKPFYYLFDFDYDVAIARRRNFYYSKNGKIEKFVYKFNYTDGLVIVKTRQFYKNCYEKLLDLANVVFDGKKYADWWGDMASIRAVIETGKYKVKPLSEILYCRKPEVKGAGNDDISVIWHYSGNKKAWMEFHGQNKNRCVCV